MKRFKDMHEIHQGKVPDGFNLYDDRNANVKYKMHELLYFVAVSKLYSTHKGSKYHQMKTHYEKVMGIYGYLSEITDEEFTKHQWMTLLSTMYQAKSKFSRRRNAPKATG